MAPLDTVLVVAGEHAHQAGVVQKVERDDAGKETAIHVRLDLDRSKLVAFAPEQLRVLKVHGF
jgi:ribosomal protein S4E